MTSDAEFLRQAIDLATASMRAGHGGPFAALIVRDDTVIARGCNRVTSSLDPTAHAEIDAIRTACRTLGSFRLDGCRIYVNCEPCPMCLAALYWAGIDEIVYAASREDAAAIGFADAEIYAEIAKAPNERRLPMRQLLRPEALSSFAAWQDFEGKIPY